ncbi:MAG: M6 family metalloprotease domain-containing protein [Muribaculaceae bacterium]|nr:M6 family metalloprotease domain-containing protein [Muribaculaceae bacterium]
MKRILLSIVASGLCAGAMAIPAKPGLIAYTQPDGTVINIKIVGDEHGHMIYTESDMLLVKANGRLEYAQFDAYGLPQASGIVASADGELKAKALNLQSAGRIERWAEKLNAVRGTRLGKPAIDIPMQMATTRAEETDGVKRLVPLNFGRTKSSFPTIGEQKGLVILVEFADVEFEYGDYEYFHRMLNEEGFSDYGSLGSARDWFIENSDGRFIPEFDVYGPVKLPKDRSFYGENDVYGNDAHPYDMTIDACKLLDEKIDFTEYDRDGDGVIDNVFLFYAGLGEHDSGITDAVWPHSWDLSVAVPKEEYVFDGVKLDHYACTCEYPRGYKRPDGIGTFVHEFSHVMGLPDLYVTNKSTAFTPGEWSVMDHGPYNNDRLTPPNYSSYEKCALGWIEMLPFREGRMEIPDLSASNTAFALPTDNENEFYFFENRQQHGNDEFLPGHGMLVWHIDYKEALWTLNAVNNTGTHQYVDLIEADNVKSKSTRAADPFPGRKNITSFGFDTKPSLASWSKQRLAYDLEDIAESEDGLISFNAVPYEENAVGEIETVGEKGVYYDLMGRRVSNPSHGIYIHNGKKIIL